MKYQHRKLAQGRWRKLCLAEQMANIGSEVERAINWREKNNDYSKQAIFRALELLSLSIDDPKNKTRLKEITRLYEVLVDYFLFDNQYSSTDVLWRNYFLPFNWLARLKI